MNERTRKTIVFAALPLTVAWGAYNLLRSPSQKPIAPPETIQPVSTEASSASNTPLFDTSEVAAADWGHDPFRMKSAPSTSAKSKGWTVTGIVFNSSSPVAYVNRQMVREGDTVDKAKVISINRKSVVLEYRGDRIEISITKG